MHSKKQTLCIVRNTHRATSYTQCVFVNKTTLCKIPTPLIFTNKIRFIFYINPHAKLVSASFLQKIHTLFPLFLNYFLFKTTKILYNIEHK